MKNLLRNHIKGYVIKIFGLFLIMVFQILLSLKIPMILQEYIDNTNTKTIKILMMLAISYLVFNIIAKGINIFAKYVAETIGWGIFNRVRNGVMEKLLGYDQKFYNENSSGKLLEFLERDINILYNFSTGKMLEMILNIGLIIGILFVFFLKNIYIGIVFFIYVLCAFLIIYKSTRVDREVLNEFTEVKSFNIGKYSEWLHAKKDIQVLGAVDYIKNKMEEMDIEYKKKEVKSQAYLYRIWSITLLLVALATVFCLFIGGKLFLHNIITIGMVYLMYTFSTMLKGPFENFQSQMQIMLYAKVAYERLDSILKYEPEVRNGKLNINNEIPNIRLEHVTYSYGLCGENVLKNITFEIFSKEIIGVMGVSGSGKSTFCKLLSKMIEPTSGKIYINEIELSNVSCDNLRQKLTYLSTNAPVFMGTIRDNLIMFNSKISDDQIIYRLDEYGMLEHFENINKNFLDLEIKNLAISDGQRQIISLCRTLFKESSIIIFDEASSKIDPIIQKHFQFVLQKLNKSNTIIIVSHEVDTLELCNRIAIFENSELVNLGYKKEMEKDINSAYHNILRLSGENL